LIVYCRVVCLTAYVLMRQSPTQLPVFSPSITTGDHRNDTYGYVG
jgi:hypothetical protein